MSQARPWPLGLKGLGYGGDYNPEQWPRAVHAEDVELMRAAGVSIVSVAIFSWAWLEPREGEYEAAWLDEVMDRLHAAGIRVCLATATASPPPWLTRKHPEILPETADGTVLHPGARQAYSVTSPVYREHAVRMTRFLAERYGKHPALAMWHVDNELGCHVPHDYSDDAAVAFRRWLAARYGDVDALNEAWGTAFWSQRYGAFEEVLPPRIAPTYANPTQQLDFARFSSDALLEHYRALRAVLAEVTPQVPATTNLLVGPGTKWMDYPSWAPHLDVVSTDHYVDAADPEGHVDLALSADMTRGLAGGHPWFLMEHSTSAVNWQERNRAKGPGEMLRNSLAHVARGADAVCFFQWRQSAAGAEKYHSAMLPHAGTDSEVWRTTVRLGEVLRSLAPVRGSRVRADVAILVDHAAWWGAELDSHPSQAVRYADQLRAWYRQLWHRGITADVVHPAADLTGYRLVVAPTLYLVGDTEATALARAAEEGASVVVTYFSGIVDENDHVRLGGYPGAFRELLGVRTEEFFPLLADERLVLDDGSTGDLWSERTHLEGAEAVRTWRTGALAGWPAVTRRAVGRGAAWYVATRLDAVGASRLVDALVAEAGVLPVVADVPAGVEVVRRRAEPDAGGRSEGFLFVLNHTDQEAVVEAVGTDLVTGRAVDGTLHLPPFEVAVVHEPAR